MKHLLKADKLIIIIYYLNLVRNLYLDHLAINI